jgi:hypothetical protein
MSDATNTLARFSIGYVARSFSSDPAASRRLLEKIFDPERMDKYAYSEVPALTREIAYIAPFDPEFVVSIYGRVFGHHVDSERETRMTPSHIMPMTSNEAQDYDIARYSLAQYFPTLLEEDPVSAAEAVIVAIDGDIVVRGRISGEPVDQIVNVDGKQLLLREDGSAIWAWDRNSTHPESLEMILGQFVGYLHNVSGAEAAPVLAKLFEKNRVALLWARLLMIGAARPEVFGDTLWGLATNERMILSSNVGNDAIDAVAAFYSSRRVAERRAFELAAFDFGKNDPVHRSVRKLWLATLFQTIGVERLVTDEARAFLATEEGSKPSPNARFGIVSSRMEVTQRQMLREAGVDLDLPANNDLVSLAEEVKSKVGLVHGGNTSIENISEAIEQLGLLHAATQDPAMHDASNDVLCAAEDIAGDLCTAILGTAARKELDIAGDDLVALKQIAIALSLTQNERFGRAPRAGVVPALFTLCQHTETIVESLPRLEGLATDTNISVRIAVARNLVTLYHFAPEKMWEVADKFVALELDAVVIQNFAAAFLSVTRGVDAARTEEMLLAIHCKFPFSQPRGEGSRRNDLDETIAYLFALLYVWHDRQECGQEIFRWTANPLRHEEQIRSGLWMVREAACAGYDADTPTAREPRKRLQRIITAIVDRTAEELEIHFRLDNAAQKAKHEEALLYAKCLGYACSSYYFGSGAFPERSGEHISRIESDAGKGRFLADTETTLRRIGDIAVPHTMYELVQLLDFLLPGNPEICFDLFIHALTTSGRKQGFQLESLGVDVLVRIVSRCLADYGHIFRDEHRRKLLIECLDIFVEAGWPAALRLLYRLPDALR